MKTRKQYFAIFLLLGLFASNANVCAQKTPTASFNPKAGTSSLAKARKQGKGKRKTDAQRKAKRFTKEDKAAIAQRQAEMQARAARIIAEQRRKNLERLKAMGLMDDADTESEAHETCSICTDSCNEHNPGHDEFGCGHTFHRKCIDQWNNQVRANQPFIMKTIVHIYFPYIVTGSCPLCRKKKMEKTWGHFINKRFHGQQHDQQ